MKRTNIALILPSPVGYSETFFKSKIQGLKENGFNVFIFCRKDSESILNFNYIFEWELSRYKIFRFIQVFIGLFYLCSTRPLKTMKYFFYSLVSRIPIYNIIKHLYYNGHILTGPKIDVLHFGFLTMGINRELLGKVLKCKVFGSIRGYDVETYPYKNPNCYNLLWKYIDKIHTISDDLALSAVRIGMPNSIKVIKITPAIDTTKFISEKKIFYKSECLKILTVGRLHWKKGYEYLFTALHELKNQGIKFKYTIIGDGDDWERLHYARYQLNLENEVQFLGRINHNEVAKFYRNNNIYIQPSVQEGFCNAVIEAQASGMICIVSDASGLAENVIDNKTGFVVQRRNSNEIVDIVKKIIEYPIPSIEKISCNAINRVKEEFDVNNQKNEFMDFYKC